MTPELLTPFYATPHAAIVAVDALRNVIEKQSELITIMACPRDSLSCLLLRESVEGNTVMANSTYFVQECPTCGRNLQIRVEYLGKQVVCQHCDGGFEACDPTRSLYPPTESGLGLLRRADELLSLAGAARIRPR